MNWSDGSFTPADRSLEHIGALNVAAVEKVKTLTGIAEMDYDEYLTLMVEK